MTYPAGPPPGSPGAQPPGAPPVCVRHPDRVTALRCTRCDRPACPECLRDAAVGHHCVDCVAQGRRGVRRGGTVAGGVLRTRPLVVPLLVAVNVAVFVWTVVESGSVGSNATAPLFQDWALVPALVAANQWWRVVTAGFLHFGLLHLAVNMLALWLLGRDLEIVLGRGRFLAVYLVSLLGGAAAVMVATPAEAEVAGASGAVFGLMGAVAVVLRRLDRPMGQVIGLIAVNIVISLAVPGISLAGHVGGLVVGVVATAALVYAPPGNRTTVQIVALGGLTVLLLAILGLSAGAL